MVRLLAFLIIVISFFIFLRRYRLERGSNLPPSGVKKTGKKPTLFDVRRLLLNGEKEHAIKIYCQIFATTPDEAKKAVEELEKNLK